MKKVILSVLMLVGLAVSTKAADGIVASDINIPQGGSAKLSVQLNNTVRDNYGGFQFELKLPAGISATSIEQAARLKAIEGYTLIMNLTNAANNIYTVLGYNTSRTNISGTSGDIAYITLSDGTSSEVGSSMTGRLQNVVLSTTDATPLNIDAANATFTITIAAPPAKVTLDENSTTAPEASEGAVNVTVNRTIKANEWSTICLPFDMTAAQVTSAFGSDVLLKRLSSWSFTGSADAAEGITMGFTTATTIEKNYPCLIKVTSNISSFDVDGVEIDPVAEEDLSSPGVGYKVGKKTYDASLYGTYRRKTTDEKDMFLANNKFWYSDGSTVIKGFRAVFYFDDVVLASYNDGGSAHVTMILDDEGTGIGNVVYQMSNETYYNLNGQRVATPGKGLYIHNGKKVIIK